MVRCTFSGVSLPIHCQHSTHEATANSGVSACELDECREAARVATQSGHPAFECVHLQSIQYAQSFSQPVDLKEKTFDALVGRKLRWFKASRKQAWPSINSLFLAKHLFGTFPVLLLGCLWQSQTENG